MDRLERIKHLRAQEYGTAAISTDDVDWLIAAVEKLQARVDACVDECLRLAERNKPANSSPMCLNSEKTK